MRTIEAKGALETVETPVLLFGTTNDQLVAWNAIERAGQRPITFADFSSRHGVKSQRQRKAEEKSTKKPIRELS